MIRISLAVACAAAGLAPATPANAGSGESGCAAPPRRAQLVCSSNACLRLETRLLCEATVQRQPARQAIRAIAREERSARALDRLIASID